MDSWLVYVPPQSEVSHGAVSSQRTCTTWNLTLLGKSNTRTTFEMGPLADNVKVGYLGKRGHFD